MTEEEVLGLTRVTMTCSGCDYNRDSSVQDIRKAHESGEKCPKCGTVLIDENDWQAFIQIALVGAFSKVMTILGLPGDIARFRINSTPLREGGEVSVEEIKIH